MFQYWKMYRQKTPQSHHYNDDDKQIAVLYFVLNSFRFKHFFLALYNKTRKENNDHVTFYVLSWCEVGARELVKCRNAFLSRLGFKPPTLKGNLWLNGCLKFETPKETRRRTHQKNNSVWHTTSAANCWRPPPPAVHTANTERLRIYFVFVQSKTDTERALKIIKISEFHNYWTHKSFTIRRKFN